MSYKTKGREKERAGDWESGSGNGRESRRGSGRESVGQGGV